MAVKTMSVPSGSEQYTTGWHELTISKASNGFLDKGANGTKKYIELNFEGYNEHMRLRVYEAFNKKNNEEFKVASLFRYANAGIMEVLKDPTGKFPLIQYDDDTKNLIGKKINAYFYREQKTGNEWLNIFDGIAPVVQEGEHLSYTQDQVNGIKESIKKNLDRMLSYNNNSTQTVESADIPF